MGANLPPPPTWRHSWVSSNIWETLPSPQVSCSIWDHLTSLRRRKHGIHNASVNLGGTINFDVPCDHRDILILQFCAFLFPGTYFCCEVIYGHDLHSRCREAGIIALKEEGVTTISNLPCAAISVNGFTSLHCSQIETEVNTLRTPTSTTNNLSNRKSKKFPTLTFDDLMHSRKKSIQIFTKTGRSFDLTRWRWTSTESK